VQRFPSHLFFFWRVQVTSCRRFHLLKIDCHSRCLSLNHPDGLKSLTFKRWNTPREWRDWSYGTVNGWNLKSSQLNRKIIWVFTNLHVFGDQHVSFPGCNQSNINTLQIMRPYRKENIFNQWIGKGCYHGFQISLQPLPYQVVASNLEKTQILVKHWCRQYNICMCKTYILRLQDLDTYIYIYVDLYTYSIYNDFPGAHEEFQSQTQA